MSLGEGGSDYSQNRDSRVKINNLVFPSSSGRAFPRCPSCLEAWKMEVSNTPEGKRIGKCIRGCGKTFDLEQTINQDTGGTMLAPKRYVSKYGSVGKQHSFLISQKTKKKQLDESDREDISNAFGSSGQGVTKVDERTEYFQDGGTR